MNWTPEQRDAIESPGDLIVSAAAGAGKTAVLTERIAMCIAAGTPVDNLLVLTFTRAAAAEMKSRIMHRLGALAHESHDAAARQYLLAQSRAVGGAYISTVHAFCARVLRRHYHVLGLAPNPRVLDETESAALAAQAQDELLTALAAEENASWMRLLATFGGEDAAWSAVSALHTFLQSQSAPGAWLDAATGRYATGEGLSGLLAEVLNGCKDELRLGLSALTALRDGLGPEWAGVIAVLDEDLMRARALLLMGDYDAYRQGLLDMAFATMRFPKDTAESEKQPVKDVREAFKKLVRGQRDRLYRAGGEECGAMRRAGVALLALRDVERAFDALFSERKRERGALDFSDLEHLALAALQQGDVAAEYREKFRLIAVDEYQDSNRVQEAILDAIRREGCLFLVGDVKQSIYRFRQAEPALFLEKLARFHGAQGRRIDLNQNFRSAPEVLAAVNETFGHIMTRDVGELDYDARARLVHGGAEEHGGAELHIIERETDGDDALEAALDAEVEARLAASRIAKLMEKETVTDAQTGRRRKLAYADFAVLLRATTHAGLVAQTLSQCGVPCYAQLNGGYFDAVEVQVLLNLLRVVDNRRQDVPLLSVLLSSIGDFGASELMRIRARRREGTFFDALQDAAASDPKVAGFFAMLARYRAESALVGMERLVGLLLDETGFYEEMGAGFSGRQRQANLDALLAHAHAFEQTGARGVSGFLRHMDLARSHASIGAAQTMSANVVRILTVHKSKGLEFPVVFLMQTGARFNLSARGSAELQIHARLGLGLRYRDGEAHRTHDTAIRETISETLRSEQLSEELRVLYVAMTRAKTRLIVTGCCRNARERLARAAESPTPFAVRQAGTPLGWLLLARPAALDVTCHARADWLSAPEEEARPELSAPDPDLLTLLTSRFDWTYPYASAVKLPAKAAVSRVSERTRPLEPVEGMAVRPYPARAPVFEPPAFLADTRTPAFFGTAMHAALERLPLPERGAADGDEDAAWPGAEAFIARLLAHAQLAPEQAEIVEPELLDWFVGTTLYKRMKKSHRVERELPFSYAIDAAALFDTDADERVLLQGVVDCCFVEAGRWVLVDYKTDRVGVGETAESVAAGHAGQLALYATALSALTGMPVGERLVVLLRQKTCVRLDT